jgi:hypothetical protein
MGAGEGKEMTTSVQRQLWTLPDFLYVMLLDVVDRVLHVSSWVLQHEGVITKKGQRQQLTFSEIVDEEDSELLENYLTDVT